LDIPLEIKIFMMKRILIFCALLLLLVSVKAQDLAPTIISTAGKDLSASGYKLSFTIGELAVTTLKSSNYILTQGFQQPPNLYLSDIKKNNDYRIAINLYPNPTQDIVNISLTDFFNSNQLIISVYNSFGQLVNVPFESFEHSGGLNFKVDLTGFARGNYFINIYNVESSEIIANFKVIKIN